MTNADRLRAAGLRVTPARPAILEAVRTGHHPGADEIARAGASHHHAVCRGCGTVTSVDCAAGHAPCLEPAVNAGYTIDEAEVTFWGLCANCQVSVG
jgi:Fur family transcriptional regulator, stress-responsive regulator